jgi:hypothetical protein
MISKLITGGQTGADQGALLAARAADVPTGGHAPAGYLTETGPAPWLADFGLVEMESRGDFYRERTRCNVADAGACLWFGDPNSPGGRLTLGLCYAKAVPTFSVLTRAVTPESVAAWLTSGVPTGAVLLVAGNRESKNPGIGERVRLFMDDVFRLLRAAP